MKPIVVVLALVAAATIAHFFMGNLIPEICGIISVVVFIDAFLAVKETAGDEGELCFQAYFLGGVLKTAIATVMGAISIGWVGWAMFGKFVH